VKLYPREALSRRPKAALQMRNRAAIANMNGKCDALGERNAPAVARECEAVAQDAKSA
jgi:hypothetical protein